MAEANNLAEQMPEKLAELKAVYRNWYDDVSSTRSDNYAPPRIIVGSEYEMVSDLSIQDKRVETDQGWGSNGKWLVTVAEAGSYTAKVQWANPIGEREVTVHLGKITASGNLGENESEILFTGLQLSAGNAEFRVKYSGEQSRQNTPRFLKISRRP